MFADEIVSAHCIHSCSLLKILKPNEGTFKVFTDRKEIGPVLFDQPNTQQEDLLACKRFHYLLLHCPFEPCRKESCPGPCLFEGGHLTHHAGPENKRPYIAISAR